MLKVYSRKSPKLQVLELKDLDKAELLWLDLLNPSPEEKAAAEELLGITIPNQEEIMEIELSSRIYREGGVDFLTTPIITNSESLRPQSSPVCFILLPQTLLTLRFAEPTSFGSYAHKLNKAKDIPNSSQQIIVGLLETIADRMADILEKVSGDLENTSHNIFSAQNGLQNIIQKIGHSGDLLSKAQETLAGLSRILSYLEEIEYNWHEEAAKAGLHAVHHDVNSISEYAITLSNKITFLLDASLGMINIEQNKVLKIFALLTLIMMPPTIIVGFFGMNFHYMIIDLEWNGGPFLAIILMFLSALIPFWYLHKKGWF